MVVALVDADAPDDAGDCWLTAYLVICADNYTPVRRPTPGFKFKSEPLEARQSKLLMLILADAEWSKVDPEPKASPADMLKLIRYCRGQADLPTPHVFPRMDQQLSAEDKAAAKKWLRDHAETYRLERLSRVK